MEITQAGKERASSAEFYQYLKTTVAKLKAQKLHDGMLAVLISNIIGWVLTGHEVDQPPDAQLAEELSAFVQTHADEINAIARDHLEN
jgi:hypothetical protein